VRPFFEKIINCGGEVGIFSSIPVHAQKLIFSNSPYGDITPFISYYFDSRIGKLDTRTSFCNVANAVHYKPQNIHFFSANPKELLAAQSAEYNVTLVNRSEKSSSDFRTIMNFMDDRLFF
jgi:enolase-phosphatase E1